MASTRKEPVKTIPLDTSVNPLFLQETLTQDITTLEALIDMIDNSIDAAREQILATDYSKDDFGLPSDYNGYHITVRIDSDSVRILDDSYGIGEETLRSSTFQTGMSKKHSFGIGFYGLGLKRSLLKIGTNYGLLTDDGVTLYKAVFKNDSFGGRKEHELTADCYASTGKKRTLFSVSNLHKSVKYDIESAQWYDNAIENLSIRYAIFIEKGLTINLVAAHLRRQERVSSYVPKLRKNALVPRAVGKPIKVGDVTIYIESGIHEKYRFKGEEGYSLTDNKKITYEFGQYFVCNDRIIVAANTDKQHGWKAKWHQEYNGYVCWVRFISENSGDLPWNTSKTALKTDSTLFLDIRSKLSDIADAYRSNIKARYIKAPDRVKSDGKPKDSSPEVSNASDFGSNQDGQRQADDGRQNSAPEADSSTSHPSAYRVPTRITASSEIHERLEKLDSRKLQNLYRSLRVISLVEHPAIMYVGAWAFLESLASKLGKDANTDMFSYMNGKVKEWVNDRGEKSTLSTALEHVSQWGNSTKHHRTHYPVDARQLENVFEVLKPFIVAALDKLLSEQNSGVGK